MKLPSHAQVRRRRRGQPDSAVDPELSRKRREAAFARWSKRGKQYTPAQAELGVTAGAPTPVRGGVLMPRTERWRDESLARRVAGQLEAGRLGALQIVADVMPEAATTLVETMRNANVPANVKRQTALDLLGLGGLGGPKGELAEFDRPADELTSNELQALLDIIEEELARRKAEESTVDGEAERVEVAEIIAEPDARA